MIANAVEAVVPVAASHERESVRAKGRGVFDGCEAVFEERGGTGGDFVALYVKLRSLISIVGEKGYVRIENIAVSGKTNIFRGAPGEPERMIGRGVFDAVSGVRRPPGTDIAVFELLSGGGKDMLPGILRIDIPESDGVLELIAKAEGASRLVEPHLCPEARGHGLVGEPGIKENIESAVRTCQCRQVVSWFPKSVRRIEQKRRVFFQRFACQGE